MRLAWILPLVLFLSMESACQNMPIAKAQTVDQKAFALYGTFVIFEEQAATLVQTTEVPQSAKNAIAKADAKAKPTMDSLLGSVRLYENVQSELAAGKTTQDKVVIATADLSGWIKQAGPLVDELVAAVKGAKRNGS